MDQLTLGQACQTLSSFGLGALFLGCRHGRLPELVVHSLDDPQVSALAELLAEPGGCDRIRQRVTFERDVRAGARMQ